MSMLWIELNFGQKQIAPTIWLKYSSLAKPDLAEQELLDCLSGNKQDSKIKFIPVTENASIEYWRMFTIKNQYGNVLKLSPESILER